MWIKALVIKTIEKGLFNKISKGEYVFVNVEENKRMVKIVSLKEHKINSITEHELSTYIDITLINGLYMVKGDSEYYMNVFKEQRRKKLQLLIS